jgi:hypothetical protein
MSSLDARIRLPTGAGPHLGIMKYISKLTSISYTIPYLMAHNRVQWHTILKSYIYQRNGRSPWPHRLRRRSSTVRLLESRQGHGCLSFASVVCCQLEVSALGWSPIQGSPTECVTCLSVIVKPEQWGHPDPLGTVGPLVGGGVGAEMSQKLIRRTIVKFTTKIFCYGIN